MASGYTRSPKLLKGALIEFSNRFIGPIPNIIMFQYNPETLSRTLDIWTPKEDPEGKGSKTHGVADKASSDVQPSDPPETFTLTLELDATDDLEVGDPVAVVTGVADRIAAMEMLLYPDSEDPLGGLLGSLTGSLSIGSGGAKVNSSTGTKAKTVPPKKVPVVLFVWGPGRIVPVRLTSFSVEEQAFSPLLYPIRAKVSVGLRIRTPADFPKKKDVSREFSENLAIGAFKFTRKQKEILAAANLANSVESILGMLPF